MLIIFDSHSHIQFSEFDKDRNEVIERAERAGVKMLAVGADFATSQKAVEVARQYSGKIWAAVGFHPNDLSEDTREAGKTEEFNPKKILDLAKDEKVVAIGECGLDYYRLGDKDAKMVNLIKENQKRGFIEQLKVAEDLNKPLMIHCRSSKGTDDANQDFFDLLRSAAGKQKVIMHFYSGSLEMAKKFFELGCYFTFGGVVTFSRDKDEIIKYLPLERILLETDAPYVAPEPYRGKRNEPAYVVEIVKRMAGIKGVSFEETASQTYNNAKEVFGI